MPAKGKRRRARNQRRAHEEKQVLLGVASGRSCFAHVAAADDRVVRSLTGSGKRKGRKGADEDAIPKSLRRILQLQQFTQGQAQAPSKASEGAGRGTDAGARGASKSSKVQAKARGSEEPKRGGGAARRTPGQARLEASPKGGIAKKPRKKGYLDVRKERKQAKRRKRAEDASDDDLGYDSRAFFDEVAYQPPGIALQRAKALVKRPKQTRR